MCGRTLTRADVLPEWLTIALSVLGGILLLWVALLVVLLGAAAAGGQGMDWRGVLRFVPDVIPVLDYVAEIREICAQRLTS